MLESSDLPNGLANVSAHRRRENLEPLNIAVWIDDEAPPGFDAAVFVIYSVHPADAASGIRKHRKGNILADHLRQLVIVPHLVHEYTVYTHGKNFNTQAVKLFVLLSNC